MNKTRDDKFYKMIEENIATKGQQLIGVLGDAEEPPFTYTIGLEPVVGYELIVFGVPYKDVAYVLNDIGQKLRGREIKIEMNEPDARWANMPVVFKMCRNVLAAKYAIQARRYWGKEVELVQIVLPDRAGKFPAELGFDAEYMSPLQPLLYE